jgi:hypothetical protein
MAHLSRTTKANEAFMSGTILPPTTSWQEGWMKAPMETAPVMDRRPQDLDNLVEALRAYQAIYSPLLQRREQREGAEKYLHGLLL